MVAQLEEKPAANPQKLNWRTSIVDLLKLLDIDSSLAARKELATELGCPADLMADSAKMNIWLHKTVLAVLHALPLGYLCLPGSARKIREITAQALPASVTPVTALTTPIGVPIGSRTPEEIAVSIAAELIRIRHQHHGETSG